MHRSLLCVLAVVVLSSLAPVAQGQRGRRYFDESDFHRLGLEQAWSSHVQVDSSRSQVSAALLQIVGMDSHEQLRQSVYEVYEVTYDGRTIRFSENDVDAVGNILGRDEAMRLAEKRMILLKARGFEPTLTTREVPPTVLYVQSNTGTLHALDAETGKSLWAVLIGRFSGPVVGPAANDRFVATVNGSNLHLLDRASGEPVWDRPLGLNPTGSMAMSRETVFVAGGDGRVEGYPLPNDKKAHVGTPPWLYNAGGRVTAVPLTTPTTISWGTSQGRLVVAQLDGPEVLYRRQVGGSISERPAFLPPDRLVIASTNGYVTAISESDGAGQWAFSTGFDIYQRPIALADSTYVVSSRHELFSIASASGDEQWVAKGVERILACGQNRIYARGVGGTLIALDKATGAQIGATRVDTYDLSWSNDLTDRIYLLTSNGTIVCLRETDAHEPTFHRPLPQPDDETTGVTTRDLTTPAADASTEAGGTDDFGEDMFGMDTEPSDAAGFGDNFDNNPAPSTDDPPADDSDNSAPSDEEFDDPFDFG